MCLTTAGMVEMRQSEILKGRNQLGVLDSDGRTITESILWFESVDWIYLNNYQLLINDSFMESVSCMCSVVGWSVINELKGMWKETVIT
jgi:hypothetical protein